MARPSRRVLLNVASRPLRPLVLVPRDISTEDLAELTKWLCSLWGGDQIPLIPFSRGRPISEDYLALAERSDPDCAVVAGEFAEYKDEPALQTIERIGLRLSSELRHWSPDQVGGLDWRWRDSVTGAPAVHRYLNKRFQDTFFQAPSLLFILDYPTDHRLTPFCAYTYGAALPRLREFLEERLQPVTKEARRMGVVTYLRGLREAADRITLPQLTRQGLTARWPTIRAEDTDQAFAQMRNHCSVVIADDEDPIDGFCLAWTLRRCYRHEPLLFLPRSAVTRASARVALQALVKDVFEGCDSLHVFAPRTSRRAAKTLAGKCIDAFRCENVFVRFGGWERAFVRGITQICEERNVESEVLNNVASFSLPPFLGLGRDVPDPVFPKRDLPTWAIDVEVYGLHDAKDGHLIPPKAQYQGRIGLNVPTRNDQLGLARVTPTAFTFRTDRADAVARLDLGTAHDLLRPLAGPHGIGVATRDASRRFKHAVNLFGGLEALLGLYREEVRELVEKLVPHLRGGESDPAGSKPSVDLRKLLRSLGKDKPEHKVVRGAVKSWLRRGVLIRAYSVTCRECGYPDLYDLEDAGNFLTCRGCRGTIPLPLDARTHIRFSEVIHRTLAADGGYAAIMTLLRFRHMARRSFFWSAAVDLEDQGSGDKTDADLVCFIDGACCLVECKTLLSGKSRKTLASVREQWTRLSEFGATLGVDCVVLATLLDASSDEAHSLKAWGARSERKHGLSLRMLHQGDLFATQLETSSLSQLVARRHPPERKVVRVGKLIGRL